MNDSLVDFDMLARLDPATGKIKGPSVYSEMVRKGRGRRGARGRRPMDWGVSCNRMATLDARNKRRVASALEALARRIGFRLVPGFGSVFVSGSFSCRG